MSLYVDLICIGPFDPKLARYYEYPEESYSGLKPGNPVITELFGIVEGTDAGRRFAACLGIDDVWDFNQHKVDVSKIDFVALENVLRGLAEWHETDQYKNDLKRLKAFSEHGYDIYFKPNG